MLSISALCGQTCHKLLQAIHKITYEFFKKEFTLSIDNLEIRFFAIVMSVNYPLYWLIWPDKGDLLDISLRLLATLSCLGLFIGKQWPQSLQPLFPFFSYVTLIFCLPFFFTFMTLKYHGSTIWLMNCMSALFFNLMITSIFNVLIMSIIGILSGVIACHLFLPPFYHSPGPIDFYSLFWTFFGAISIGMLFSYRKYLVQEEKFKMLKAMSGAIAHEMRTPLGGMRAVCSNIKFLINRYKTQRSFSVDDTQHLEQFADSLETLINRSHTTIDLMLANLKEDLSSFSQHILSMQHCVENSLASYPFTPMERKCLHLTLDDDFIFQGNKELMQHVLFNLLNNSLYFIQEARRGQIFINLKCSDNHNILIFKDTAKGISFKALPLLFKPFYTNRPHGTGIGLAFCQQVLKVFGGRITCQSLEGEFATFLMYFPKVNRLIYDDQAIERKI